MIRTTAIVLIFLLLLTLPVHGQDYAYMEVLQETLNEGNEHIIGNIAVTRHHIYLLEWTKGMYYLRIANKQGDDIERWNLWEILKNFGDTRPISLANVGDQVYMAAPNNLYRVTGDGPVPVEAVGKYLKDRGQHLGAMSDNGNHLVLRLTSSASENRVIGQTQILFYKAHQFIVVNPETGRIRPLTIKEELEGSMPSFRIVPQINEDMTKVAAIIVTGRGPSKVLAEADLNSRLEAGEFRTIYPYTSLVPLTGTRYINNHLISHADHGLIRFDGQDKPVTILGNVDWNKHHTSVNPGSLPFATGAGDSVGLHMRGRLQDWTVDTDGTLYGIFTHRFRNWDGLARITLPGVMNETKVEEEKIPWLVPW